MRPIVSLAVASALHLFVILLLPATRPATVEPDPTLEFAVDLEPPAPSPTAAATFGAGPPAPTVVRAPPPPAAARAARAHVTERQGDPIPVASAETFPGGVTHPAATSSAPILDPNARPWGVPGGTGTGGGGGWDKDLSEPARLTDKRVWDCPWPPKAEALSIFLMRVHVRVLVSADGRALEVRVLDDPGNGFGDFARSCALQQRYVAARDRRGDVTVGSTQPFVVIFDRFATVASR